MAENAGFVQGGLDRVNEAYRSLDAQVQKIQKELRSRRRSLESQLQAGRKSLQKQVTSGRKTLEKRTRRQISELRRASLLKRARALSEGANQRLEEGVGSLLGLLRIASRSELSRIDRKLDQIARKLREIDKERGAAPKRRPTNGSAAHL